MTCRALLKIVYLVLALYIRLYTLMYAAVSIYILIMEKSADAEGKLGVRSEELRCR